MNVIFIIAPYIILANKENIKAICYKLRVNILAYQNSKERNLVRQLFCTLKEKLLGQRKSFS